MKKYQVLVLGSGAGGKLLSWSLSRQGLKTALIEKRYIGGSCPNIACLPSKNVIHSAKVSSYFRRSHEFGIDKDNVRIDMKAVRERKRKMVRMLVEKHLANFKNSGVDLVIGEGKFIGPKIIEVKLPDGTYETFEGDKIIISTGSRTTIGPIPGLREASPMTHIEALELEVIPEHLIILGGGYVGLEFAQAMRRFGSRVTIIEKNERLVHREDEDVSKGVQELFADEGIDILTETRVVSIEGKSGQGIKVNVNKDGANLTLDGSHLLVATGRTPNTDGIGLELAGIAVNERGYIKVNEKLETTAHDVWAVGDCAGSPQFTHIAENDYRVVLDNINGIPHTTNDRQIPFCIFTDPEVARVGLSEKEAAGKGLSYHLVKIPMGQVFRALTLSETRGFMKALIDVKSEKIIGFTCFGEGAGEIMSAVQVAMIAGLPYTALKNAIFTHPTLIEGLNTLFSAERKFIRPNDYAAWVK